MEPNSEAVHQVLERVLEQVRRWPDVRVAGGEGVTQLLLQRGVLARFHLDGMVEIPFPRPVGEKLVAAGRAEHHHALPDSGWVDARVAGPADEPRVIELLRLAYQARRPGAAAGTGRDESGAPPTHTEEIIDQSVEETFPASDPPAPGRE